MTRFNELQLIIYKKIRALPCQTCSLEIIPAIQDVIHEVRLLPLPFLRRKSCDARNVTCPTKDAVNVAAHTNRSHIGKIAPFLPTSLDMILLRRLCTRNDLVPISPPPKTHLKREYIWRDYITCTARRAVHILQQKE